MSTEEKKIYGETKIKNASSESFILFSSNNACKCIKQYENMTFFCVCLHFTLFPLRPFVFLQSPSFFFFVALCLNSSSSPLPSSFSFSASPSSSSSWLFECLLLPLLPPPPHHLLLLLLFVFPLYAFFNSFSP